MSKIGKEFKAFITRGNMMDMAVGIIIGGAFTAIVTSLVNDILMPLLGLIIGRVNLTDLKYVFVAATETAPEAALYYGKFFQSILNFLLIALVIFFLVKGINAFHKKKEVEAPAAPAPQPSKEELLLTEIRDLLKEGKN